MDRLQLILLIVAAVLAATLDLDDQFDLQVGLINLDSKDEIKYL